MRQLISMLTIGLVAAGLAACGSDSSSASEEPVATEAATEEPAATETPVSEPASDEPVADQGEGTVGVNLVEWAVEAPSELEAGTVTFDVVNGGSFTHELVVIAGDGYASLPQEPSGAVIEDELPDGALLGRTSRLSSGGDETLTVDLAPGNYVLLCNISVGPNSHAGAGQVLDITVT